MYKLLLLLGLSSAVLASYSNCDMKNESYEEICKRVVERGVSYDYANEFLISCGKTNETDAKSWKYLHPDKVQTLRKNEKKANNTLLPHVPRIVKHIKKYKEVYDYAEKEFGVNREIVAAILMKETALGRIKLKHDAFKVCNTMVVKNDPKTPRDEWLMEMGKSNMASIIEHCYKKGIVPGECNIPSSYAGAVGIPQFMPDSFIYAVAYKDKFPDLNKMEDAIVSVSNFLNAKAGFDKLLKWDKIANIRQIEAEWYNYELEYKNSSLVYTLNKRDNTPYDCFLCKDFKYMYLRDYAKKIMVYNNSSNYSIGVIRIAYESHLRLNK